MLVFPTDSHVVADIEIEAVPLAIPTPDDHPPAIGPTPP